MQTLIKNGLVLTLDFENWLSPQTDILIENGAIKSVGKQLEIDRQVDHVIDANGKLVMPGWINADLHASEVLFKGYFENLNLDQRPDFTEAVGCKNSELVYATALYAGMEAIKSGVTTVQDHWLFPLTSNAEQLEAVMAAYSNLGLRTTLAVGVCSGDGGFHNRLITNQLPAALRSKNIGEQIHPKKAVDYLCQVIEDWYQSPGQIQNLTIAPELELLLDAGLRREILDLIDRFKLGIHFHFNETKLRALDNRNCKIQIQTIAEWGLLNERTSISHATWITPEDMDVLAKHQVNLIHTPLSELYSGSGLLPIHQLSDRSISVALGSGIGCGGSQNFFEALKITGSIQRIVQPDYDKWPSTKQLLIMGTQAGAKASMWQGQTGCIAPGYQADLVFYDLQNIAFTPLNELEFQLIYLGDGSSIDSVMVDGLFLMRNGSIVNVDEQEVVRRFSHAQKEFDRQNSPAKLNQLDLMPYKMAKSNWAVSQPFTVNRWANQPVLKSKLKTAFSSSENHHENLN